MTDPQKPAGWWQTLPGIFTALAAFITAVSGLIALLYQNGWLGKKLEHAPPGISATAAVPEQAAPANISSANRKPWSDVVAVVVSQDGTQTRVRANSFCNCISVNHELTLEAGQAIPFERMSSFEVLRADDHTTPNAKAHIKVKLLSGEAISGTVEANCDLFAYNDLGRFSTFFDQVRSVRFEY